MATTAGSPKRAWQRTQRPTFDDQSRKVWRMLLSIVGLLLIVVAAIAWWASLTPPSRTLLVSITDDREEFATVPPVPMLEQDEAALKSWAQATEAPFLSRKLSSLKGVKSFCDSLFAASDGLEFETLDVLGKPTVQRETFRKGDTLLLHIRAHGLALLTPGQPEPQPFLVKSFKNLEDLTQSNSISVADLLKTLATHEDLQVVVVLDAVHFNYDPRLGQLVNEFPTAVANAMPANAKNLWVVLPSTSGEITVVSAEQERTLFNLALLESWQEEKAGGAGKIALPELVQLIKDRYKELREDEDDLEFWQTAQQLPRVQSGQVERNGSAVFFTTIPPPKKKDKEEPAAPSEKKTTAIFPQRLPFATDQATIAAFYQPPADQPTATNPTPPATTPATPPATAPGASPPASPVPPPTTSAEPPPPAPRPAAAPADDAPPRHRPFLVAYAAQLESAWRLRDELENWQQSSGLAGWSPVHFAPHHWRRLNANLISYEERCRAGTDPQTEPQLQSDLASLISELERLKAQVQRNQPGADSDGDNFDLAKTWKAFRFGPLETPSPAWQSFQASDKNSLHDANRSLKIYADAAYRLPEYVRLQGLMHSSPGVKLDLQVELNRLQTKLKDMRGRLKRPSEDWRIQPHIATELVSHAREVQAARDFLDQRIKTFAQGLSTTKSVALPGRGQAICLLLESPLLPAGERAELLDRVLPPLNPSPAPKTIQRVNGGRPGDGSLIFDSLATQSRAYEQVIRFLTGEESPQTRSEPDGTLRGSAQYCLSELSRLTSASADQRPDTALAIGQQYRQFLSGLPAHIKKRADDVETMQVRQRIREQFDLYHWLLLVDGRDAERLAGLPIYLLQPFLAETAPDAVRITLEPKQILVSDKPQRVQVYIQLITDKVNPADLRARLTLSDDAGGELTIADPEIRSAAVRNRDVHVGGSKEWRGEFEVKAADALSRPSVLLTATAEFGTATAKDDAECRMKLPNEIDLKVVQLHRWTGDESIARAETDNKLGTEMRLYPNRDTAFKLLLRNLSSDDKTVKVQLIAAPATPRARLFDEQRELLPEFQALDRQIRSMREGLPPQIAGRVIAETNEKTPVVLKVKDASYMDVNLERKLAAIPPGSGATAPIAAPDPGVEVTSGMICVITSVANPSERFVRWLELRPYAPHELYKVGDYTFDGNQLSFQVKLMSADFADGMMIDDKPLTVVWDRSDKRLGQPPSVALEIQRATLAAQLQGSIPAGLRTVTLPLHIDGYPRALIVELKLTESGVLAERNLKADSLAAVHIARLTHEKQMFLINKPGSSFTPLTAPEDPADWLVQTLIRTSDQPTALIKLDKPPKQRLTFDLQADITAAAFARGATLEIGQEGQESRQLYHDRDIHVKLKSLASGGVLTLATTVDDYRNLPLIVDTDPADDSRVSLLAAIRGSSELSSTDAIHALPIIFDRKPPEVIRAALQPKRIKVGDKRELTPIVVDGQITDGNGAGLASLKVSLTTRPGAPPLGDGKPITLEVINNPGESFQVRRSIPDSWPEGIYEFDVLVEPRDIVGRVGEPLVLPLTIEIPKPKEKKNLQLGGEFNREVGKGIEEAKAKQKLESEIQKAKALQPPSGS